jgi:uncharacterized repeat protein (TIGR01451 family)
MKTGKNNFTATCIAAVVLCAALLGTAPDAAAAGTPAGTTIVSTVTVDFNFGVVPQSTLSATSSFVVDRLINVTVTNNSNPSAAPNQLNVPLSFRVTNTGNAAQRYALQPLSRPTNTWTMNNVRIFRDDNSSGTLDAGDALYADAGTFGDLVSDASFTVMIVADTPGAAVNGQTAIYDLAATSVDAGMLAVSVQTAGPDTAGIDTVFIDSAGSAGGDVARDGSHSDAGTFTVASSSEVTMNKTVLVLDPSGGNLPVRGATLRYMITATAAGTGTAQNVVVSDPIPANTAYTAGTLRLNGVPLTDTADLPVPDAGDVGATTPDTVTVRLGDLTSASPAQTIIFEVTIQ